MNPEDFKVVFKCGKCLKTEVKLYFPQNCFGKGFFDHLFVKCCHCGNVALLGMVTPKIELFPIDETYATFFPRNEAEDSP